MAYRSPASRYFERRPPGFAPRPANEIAALVNAKAYGRQVDPSGVSARPSRRDRSGLESRRSRACDDRHLAAESTKSEFRNGGSGRQGQRFDQKIRSRRTKRLARPLDDRRWRRAQAINAPTDSTGRDGPDPAAHLIPAARFGATIRPSGDLTCRVASNECQASSAAEAGTGRTPYLSACWKGEEVCNQLLGVSRDYPTQQLVFTFPDHTTVSFLDGIAVITRARGLLLDKPLRF